MNNNDLVARPGKRAWLGLIAAALVLAATGCGATDSPGLQSAATDADLRPAEEALEGPGIETTVSMRMVPVSALLAAPTGEALAADGPIETILSTTEEVHGWSDDPAGVLSRIMPFPKLPDLGPTYIKEIWTSLNPTDPHSGTCDAHYAVRLLVEATPEEATTALQDGLIDMGWHLEESTNETDAATGAPMTSLSLGAGAPSDGPGSFSAEILADPDTPLTLLRLAGHYGLPADSDAIGSQVGELIAKQGTASEVRVTSDGGKGRTVIDLQRIVTVTGSEESVTQTFTDAGHTEIEVTGRSWADVVYDHPAADGVHVKADEHSDGTTMVEVSVFKTFVNESLALANVVEGEEDFTPVAADADPETVLVAATASLGATTDATAKLARIGNPLAIGTPGVVDLDTFLVTQAEPVFSDGQLADIAEAGFSVDMTAEEAIAFYEAEAAGQGWTETDRASETADEGLSSTTTIEYQLAPTAPALAKVSTDALGARLKISVIDDVDAPKVRVEWKSSIYTSNDVTPRFVDTADSASVLPRPDGGELDRVAVHNHGLFSSGVFYVAEYVYEPGLRDELFAFYRDFGSEGEGYVVAKETDINIVLTDTDGHILNASIAKMSASTSLTLTLTLAGDEG